MTEIQEKTQEKEIEISKKQGQALRLLSDHTNGINELLFGGGAGGGKSYLGCIWLTQSAIQYPESRWFMSRKVGRDIRESTLLTMFDVLNKTFELTWDVDYKYREQKSRIEFSHGSMIFLKELPFIPADPECNYLGSMEYTGGFIDEAQEVNKRAKDTILSRIRYNLEAYGEPLIPKSLQTCNPDKGHLYTDFYAPFSKGLPLKKGRHFLQSLVVDNPRISPEYIKTLQNLDDEAMKQRLLYGNWDYEITSNQLVLTQWLENALVDNYDPKAKKKAALDAAREGGDANVMSIWSGDTLIHMEEINVPIGENTDISGIIANEVIRICSQWGIGYEDMFIDAVGVGGGVVDALRSRGWYAKSYKGGSSAKSNEEFTEYENLRAYSYWKFRIELQKGNIKILKSIPYRDELFRQLTAHEYEINDKMVKLMKKEHVKNKIGRSPDHSDATVMAFAPTCQNKFGFAI